MPGRDFSLHPTPPEENGDSTPCVGNEPQDVSRPLLEHFETDEVKEEIGILVFFKRLFSVMFCCFCCTPANEDSKPFNPAVQEPVNRDVPEHVNSAVPEAANSAIPEAVNPAVPELANPVVQEPVNPVVPEFVNLAVPEAVNPAPPELANPDVRELVNPAVQEVVNPAVPEVVDPAAEIDLFREEWRRERAEIARKQLERHRTEPLDNEPESPRSSRKYTDNLSDLLYHLRHEDVTDRDLQPFIYIFPTDEEEAQELHQTTIRNFFRPSANVVPPTFVEAAKAYVESWDPERIGDMEYAKSMVDQWEKKNRKQMLAALTKRPYIGYFRDSHFGGTVDDLFPPYPGQPPRRLLDKTMLVYEANEDVISALNAEIAATNLQVTRLQMYSQILASQQPPERTDEQLIQEVSESLRRRHCASCIQDIYNESSLFIIQTFYLMVIPYRYYEITVSAAGLPPHLKTVSTQEGRRRRENVHWHSEDRYMEVEQGWCVQERFDEYFRRFEANVYLFYFFEEIHNNPETKKNFLREHGEYI